MPPLIKLALALYCALLISLSVVPATFELISAEEASMPDFENDRASGISRGPRITPISLAGNAGSIKSPFNWRVEFEAFGGARIDKNRVVVTYLKEPLIDLTQRIYSFIEPSGISVEGAEVPPSEHHILIRVLDSYGHESWAELTIRVSK